MKEQKKDKGNFKNNYKNKDKERKNKDMKDSKDRNKRGFAQNLNLFHLNKVSIDPFVLPLEGVL
jgi:hypothetical protein